MIMQPVINLVNLPINAFQELKVCVVIPVVLSTHPFQQHCQNPSGCQHCKDDR